MFNSQIIQCRICFHSGILCKNFHPCICQLCFTIYTNLAFPKTLICCIFWLTSDRSITNIHFYFQARQFNLFKHFLFHLCLPIHWRHLPICFNSVLVKKKFVSGKLNQSILLSFSSRLYFPADRLLSSFKDLSLNTL